MLEYGFQKHKVPRGMSYPLKRSMLNPAIETAGIEQLQWVYYNTRPSGNLVLRAYRFGDSSKGKGAALSTIIVFAVPSNERKQTESAILGEGLGKMLGWIRSIELSGNTRRGSEQHFSAAFVDGILTYDFS